MYLTCFCAVSRLSVVVELSPENPGLAFYTITQTATYVVSRPRKPDCQDKQHNAAYNIVQHTCDVGSS